MKILPLGSVTPPLGGCLPTQAAGLAGPSLFPAVVRRELPSLTASALSLWSSQSLARAALWDLAPGVQSPCKMAVQRALSRQSVFPQKRAWSILRCSAFFTVQLSHPYMTTGKTIPLTRWTFVDYGREAALAWASLAQLCVEPAGLSGY